MYTLLSCHSSIQQIKNVIYYSFQENHPVYNTQYYIYCYKDVATIVYDIYISKLENSAGVYR